MTIIMLFFNRNSKIQKGLLFYLFFFFTIFFINSINASAASGPGLSNPFPSNDRAGLAVYLTIGEGEFNVQTAGATIIADRPGTVTVTVTHGGWCNSDGRDLPAAALTTRPYKDTYFRSYSIAGSDGNYYITGVSGGVDNLANTRECSTAGNKSFSFQVNSYIASIGKYAAVIAGSIEGRGANYYLSGTGGWTFENSFRFSISSSIGASMTLTPPGFTGNLYSFSNKLIGSTQTLNTSFFITTPCSMSPTNFQIDFFDVDNGIYQAAGTYPQLTIYARSRPSSSATYNQIHAQGQLLGGNGQYDSWIRGSMITIPLEASRHYEIQVNGLSKPNSIAFNLYGNVDPLFAASNCSAPPPSFGYCTLSAISNPVAGTNVLVTATVYNTSGQNWTYDSSQTDWNRFNYTLGVVDANKSYALLQQPRVDAGDSPGGTGGPPDYNNGNFVLSSPLGTNTTPYFLSYASYGAIVGTNGVMRYGMRQTVFNNSSATFTFYVRAPSTVGQSLKIGARVMDRFPRNSYGYRWFNWDVNGCSRTITASSAVSAICTFTSPLVEQGSYTPSATVTNTSASATTYRLSFNIADKGIYNSSSTGVSIAGGGSQTINSATQVTFNYGEEKNWLVRVTVINVADGATVGSGCNGNYIVNRKPFFRVNNGDLMVGGKYPIPNPCSSTADPTNTNLVSWAVSNTGAYAEHAIKLFGGVYEVYSAQSITSPPVANKWLTIANNAGTWGASSGSSSCMNDLSTDVYKKSNRLQFNSLSNYTIPSTWNDPANPDQIEITTSTPLPINPAGPVNFTAGKLALYVNGDVYIANNITMNTIYTSNNLATGSSDVSKIPFFALIVSGNIYIAPGVTQLDGVYISQPKTDGSKGVLYTCANSSGSAVAQGSVYGSCGSPLVFNGIVQAKNIRLLRTNGTLATNTPAETFNGRPELYIAPKPFGSGTSSGSKYDNAATLPPAL